MDEFSKCCASGASLEVKMLETHRKESPFSRVSLCIASFKPPESSSKLQIVFVPGWITRVQVWKKVLLELTKEFTVHYVETREKSSASIEGEVGFKLEDFGRDIAELVNLLNLEDGKFVLMGSSLGANAIINGCVFLEKKPAAIVLIAPNAEYNFPLIMQYVCRAFPPGLFIIAKPLIKLYLRTFLVDVDKDFEQYEKYCANVEVANPWRMKKTGVELWAWKAWDFLRNISIPALIIGASEDKMHEPEYFHKMASLLKYGSYTELKTNKEAHGPKLVKAFKEYLKSRELI